MVLSARDGTGWVRTTFGANYFSTFQCAFLRKVEEILHAITYLYCQSTMAVELDYFGQFPDWVVLYDP